MLEEALQNYDGTVIENTTQIVEIKRGAEVTMGTDWEVKPSDLSGH